MKRLEIILIVLLLTSCRDYYNDMVDWADNIEKGTTIEDVKKDQPDFLEIDWHKPIVNGGEKLFLITKIKGNKDILAMSNYLVFVDGKFKERLPMK